MLGWIVLVVIILLLVGALPAYPYSRRWGYRPGAALTVAAVIVLVLLLGGVL